jgi:hypothetical protein
MGCHAASLNTKKVLREIRVTAPLHGQNMFLPELSFYLFFARIVLGHCYPTIKSDEKYLSTLASLVISG